MKDKVWEQTNLYLCLETYQNFWDSYSQFMVNQNWFSCMSVHIRKHMFIVGPNSFSWRRSEKPTDAIRPSTPLQVKKQKQWWYCQLA